MSERLNVKDMMVEPEMPLGSLFNPERDVTDEQKQELVKEMDSSARNSSPEFVEMACALRMTGTPIEFYTLRQPINQRREEVARQNDWAEFAWLTAEEKILGLPAQITAEERSRLDQLSFDRTESGLRKSIRFSAARKILGLPVEVVESDLQRLAVLAQGFARRNNWYMFAWSAAYARILGSPISVGKLEIEGMDMYRANWRKSMSNFAGMVFAQAILFADTLSIPPDGGLELSWKDRPEFDDTPPSLPEQRAF